MINIGTFTLTQNQTNKNLYIYPNGDLSSCTEFTAVGDNPNYTCVDEDRLTPDEDITYVWWNGIATAIDIYELQNHTTETGTINYVQIYARAKSHLYSQDAAGVYKILCCPNSECSITYASADINLTAAYATYSRVWENNPDDAAAWQWTDIDILAAGIQCSSPTTPAPEAENPEIRTTQLYVRVNYDEEVECTLTKPEEISTNHSRNIKMFNFWNGTREVYDLNRSGKSMVLIGSEVYTSSCDTILCVRDMARNGSVVTISGLSLGYFNGNYRINQFGWKKISEKPEHYEWIIQLEDTEL